MVAVLPVVSYANVWTDTATGYTWTFRANGDTAEICADGNSAAISPCPTGALAIPSTLVGRKVTRIGEGAFVDCSGITNVVIPNSVIFSISRLDGVGWVAGVELSPIWGGVHKCITH